MAHIIFKGMNKLAIFPAILDKGYKLCVCLAIQLFPFEKGSILKGRNLLPRGANSFLLK